MKKKITPTQLRKNIYKLLDEVLEKGTPLEIVRKGKRLLLHTAEVQSSKLARLESHPDFIAVDPEDLVHVDWSGDWRPEP